MNIATKKQIVELILEKPGLDINELYNAFEDKYHFEPDPQKFQDTLYGLYEVFPRGSRFSLNAVQAAKWRKGLL